MIHTVNIDILPSSWVSACWQAAVGGSDEEKALRKKRRKNKEDDRFNAVKSAIIKRLGDTCDVRVALSDRCVAVAAAAAVAVVLVVSVGDCCRCCSL